MIRKFLHNARITAWSKVFVACYLLILVYWAMSSNGIVDQNGKPVGTDFITFYSASKLLQNNAPQALYDKTALYKTQKELAGDSVEFFAWHYPPTFMIFVYPLYWFNYYHAWIIWLIITIIPFLLLLNRILPHRLTTIIFLAFPGTFQNIIHGQNGFLTTSLLGYGLWFLDKRNFLAGLFLGTLFYKPQFAILVVPALLVRKNTRALLGVLTSAVFWIITTCLIWGTSPWIDFFTNLQFASKLIEDGSLPYFKMPTPMAGSLLMGLSVTTARITQLIFSIIALVITMYIWRRDDSLGVRNAILPVAAIIASPFGFDYDLVFLSLTIAWLLKTKSAHTNKRFQWALFFWILPFLAPGFAVLTGIPIASPALCLFLFVSAKGNEATNL